MNRNRINRIARVLGLSAPSIVVVACGDPCVDDGFGRPGTVCVAGQGDTIDGTDGSEDDGTPIDTGDDGDSSGAADGGEGEEYYYDADGDGIGDPAQAIFATPEDVPDGYVPADLGADCDDDEPDTYPGAAPLEPVAGCYNDNDHDGWGDGEVPAGVDAGQDCDDESETTYPGAAENEDAGTCTKDDDGDGWGDSDPPPGVDPGDDCADSDPELFGCDTLWCVDADGDGFGDPGDCMPGGDVPPSPDHVPNDEDCSDEDAGAFPGAAANEPRLCAIDADGDGWGDSAPPAGIDPGTDCSDSNPSAFPGAAANEPKLCAIDADGDGWGDASASASDPLVDDGTDCIDSDAAVYPGAAASEPGLCTVDADGDGYGSITPPAGADAGTDCDDGSAFAFPGASPNETPPLDAACTLDADGDDYGDIGAPLPVTAGTDCDDGSTTTYPGAAELDDLLACMNDADFDGYGESNPAAGVTAGQDCEDSDPAVTICGQWCFDADGDGFGDAANCSLAAEDPGPDWVPNDIDCLDTDPTVYPGAASAEPGVCTVDADGDGFGDANPPPGADPGADCDDGDANTFPGASELEAAPLDAACTTDADGDGFGDSSPSAGVTPGTDCVDTSSAVYPGAAANEPALCTVDADSDGFGDAAASASFPGADDGTDCLDSNPQAFPGASENESGALALACTLDADLDGYGDDSPPAGVTSGTDCDDAIATTYPGAAENESPIACMADADQDGYGDATPPAGVVAGVDCEDGDDTITICDQWCLDADGDGFGGSTCQLSDGAPGPDWVQNDTDCADDDPTVYPGAASLEPGLCTADVDGDGYGTASPPPGADAGADCDDSLAAAAPGAAPNDDPTACMLDADGDGWGDATPPAGVTPGTDCTDSDALTYPGAASLEPTLCTADIDGDGYGTSFPGPGADAGSDCVDSDATVYVGAAVNEPTLCTADADSDGFGTSSPPPGGDAGTDCDDSSSTTFPGAAPNDDPFACLKDDDGDDYGDLTPPAGVTPGVDCDDADPTFADCTCLAPTEYLLCDGLPGAPTADAFAAMGLGCSADPSESMVLTASSFAAAAGTWRVIHQLGTAVDPSDPTRGYWSPRPDAGNPDAGHNAGNNLLMLSTGAIGVPDGSGVLVEPAASQELGGDTPNPDFLPYPAPIVEAVGSAMGAGGTPFLDCDGVNDCSDTLQPLALTMLGLNDQVYLEFDIVVPDGVDGFRFDFAYLSSEYPTYVGTDFNDIFVAWVDGQLFTGNIAVTNDGTPFTITELAAAGEMTIVGPDPRLVGTGFEGNGATGWRSVLAPVVPGETITVGFFLADVADQFLNTAVLIDNFRWDCAGCVGVGDCGLTSLP